MESNLADMNASPRSRGCGPRSTYLGESWTPQQATPSFAIPAHVPGLMTLRADVRRLHERVECVLVIRVPARQSGPVLDDIVRRPFDPPLVHLSGDGTVRAENVEIAARQTFQHEIDCLFRGPGVRWFFG